MKSAKSLAVAAAIALAWLTFASEAFAGVSIYFGPGGGYYGGPYYGYGYGYYPRRIPITVTATTPATHPIWTLLGRPLAAALAALALASASYVQLPPATKIWPRSWRGRSVVIGSKPMRTITYTLALALGLAFSATAFAART